MGVASATRGRTPPPTFLTWHAADKWREIVRDHDDIDDLDALAAYCATYGRWRAAEEWLADPGPGHGAVVTICDDKGNVKSHAPAPQIAIAVQAAREMGRLRKALGF